MRFSIFLSVLGLSSAVFSESIVPHHASDIDPQGLGKLSSPQLNRREYCPFVNSSIAHAEDSFPNNIIISKAASSAPIPAGYSQVFGNLKAASDSDGYLGYTVLSEYDTVLCAQHCRSRYGCMAFNIYYSKSKSSTPNTCCNDCNAGTKIMCSFWAGAINSGNARDYGHEDNKFIAGSNGYMSNSIIPASGGWSEPIYLAGKIMKHPLIRDGVDTHIGSALFVDGLFNTGLCADACTKVSEFNRRHPSGVKAVQTCQFFVTYIQVKNGLNSGQVCEMYSHPWPKQRAIKDKVSYEGDIYTFDFSYAYANASLLAPVREATATATTTDWVDPVTTHHTVKTTVHVTKSTTALVTAYYTQMAYQLEPVTNAAYRLSPFAW